MDLSGYGDNLVYRNNVASADPYYYISAQLDLAGKSSNKKMYYFNKDNNFGYLANKNYSSFHKIDANAVIAEVTVYSSPDFTYSGTLSDLIFQVGGAFAPSVTSVQANPVIEEWGGPTGNSPGSFGVSELEDAQSCIFGSEPNGDKKYLVVKLTDDSSATNRVVLKGQIYVVVKVFPKFG
jgi:hypothetical protein